jgi:uncharacterized protein (DUF1684 family)
MVDYAAPRSRKDEFFKYSHRSPLPQELQHDFAGLDYFDPAEDLVFTVTPQPGDGAELTIDTSDGQQRVYRRAAVASFEVMGEPVSLALYDSGHPGYFLPFRDATSGKGTYGAGRYLDIEPNSDGTVTIDFNLAYNPFCAYNDAYSCPLPPVENWLQVPIEAGEKDFTKA